jgi:hypothetical protein
MLLKEQYQVLIKSLLPYAQSKLGFNKPPKINFIEDENNSKNPLGKTAYYHPEDKEITIFVTNRHPKDILRSVAHELVHYQQDEDGRLTQTMRDGLHDKNYTQKNTTLRKFEEEAYLNGNMIFRDWEDNYKNSSKQIIKITKESKQMNESNIRATIKKLVAEVISEEKEKKKSKKEEEQKADVSKIRDSAKKSLKTLGVVREQEDKSILTLNEWKNQELFGLLSNKFFGINLTETAKPDFLDLDKDGDKKESMKQAAKQAGKPEEEEEELDEVKLSKSETKEKERLVKGMKPKEKEFEKKYPGKGKEVMYATATKRAQEKK